MTDPENPFDEFPTYGVVRPLPLLRVEDWLKKWEPIIVEWLKCRAYFKDLDHAKDCYIKSTKYDVIQNCVPLLHHLTFEQVVKEYKKLKENQCPWTEITIDELEGEWGKRIINKHQIKPCADCVKELQEKAEKYDELVNEHEGEVFLKEMVTHQRKQLVKLKDKLWNIRTLFKEQNPCYNSCSIPVHIRKIEDCEYTSCFWFRLLKILGGS